MTRNDAIRNYIRSTKAWDLMEQITTSVDPVWAEDEFIRDVLANLDRVASDEEEAND